MPEPRRHPAAGEDRASTERTPGEAPAIPQPRDGDAPGYGHPARDLPGSTPVVEARAGTSEHRVPPTHAPEAAWVPDSRDPAQLELALVLEPERLVEPRCAPDPDAFREYTTYIPHPRRKS
jgi:hypothetical protein